MIISKPTIISFILIWYSMTGLPVKYGSLPFKVPQPKAVDGAFKLN